MFINGSILIAEKGFKKIKYVKNTLAKDVDDLKNFDGMELNPASPILETFLNNEKYVQGDRIFLMLQTGYTLVQSI